MIRSLLTTVIDSLSHFIFPHICEGCGSDQLEAKQLICLRCLSSLPQTNYYLYPNNPIEKIFWGRLPVTYATAHFYFSKDSLMQRLMHAFKYDGNQELGAYLGQLMGQSLVLSNRFSYLDALVPLPLFKSKERTRGFNQAKILCDGIAGVLGVPILNHVVQRTVHTDSQTKKGRIERWQNMEGRFALCDGQQLEGKHILLVDDVITTGATLEACGKEIMKQNNVQVSIATLCFSSGF